MDSNGQRKLNIQQGIPGVSPTRITTIPGTEYQGYVRQPDQAILDNIQEVNAQTILENQAAQPQPQEPRGGIWGAITEPLDYITSGDYFDNVASAVSNIRNNPLSPSAWLSAPLTLASGIEAPLQIPQQIMKETIGDLIYMGAKRDMQALGMFMAFSTQSPVISTAVNAFMGLGFLMPDSVRQGIMQAHGGEYGGRESGAGVWEYMQSHMDDIPGPARYPLRVAIELAVDPLTYVGIGAGRNALRAGRLGRMSRTEEAYEALSPVQKIGAQIRDIPRDPIQGVDAAARGLGVVSDTMFIRAPMAAARGALNQTPATRWLTERAERGIQERDLRQSGDRLMTMASAAEGRLATNETPMVFNPRGDQIPDQGRGAGPWAASPMLDEIGNYNPRMERDIQVPLGPVVPGAQTFEVVAPSGAVARRYVVVDQATNIEYRIDERFSGDIYVSNNVNDEVLIYQDMNDAFDHVDAQVNSRVVEPPPDPDPEEPKEEGGGGGGGEPPEEPKDDFEDFVVPDPRTQPSPPIVPEMQGVHRQFQAYPHLQRALEQVYALSTPETPDADGAFDPFWREYAESVRPYGAIIDRVEREKTQRIRDKTQFWTKDGRPEDPVEQTVPIAMASFHIERLADQYNTPLPANPYTVTEGSDLLVRKRAEIIDSKKPKLITLDKEEAAIMRRDLPMIYQEILLTTDNERSRLLRGSIQRLRNVYVPEFSADEARALLPENIPWLPEGANSWRDLPGIGSYLDEVTDHLSTETGVKASDVVGVLRQYIESARRQYEVRTPFVRQERVLGRDVMPKIGTRQGWNQGPFYQMDPRDPEGMAGRRPSEGRPVDQTTDALPAFSIARKLGTADTWNIFASAGDGNTPLGTVRWVAETNKYILRTPGFRRPRAIANSMDELMGHRVTQELFPGVRPLSYDEAKAGGRARLAAQSEVSETDRVEELMAGSEPPVRTAEPVLAEESVLPDEPVAEPVVHTPQPLVSDYDGPKLRRIMFFDEDAGFIPKEDRDELIRELETFQNIGDILTERGGYWSQDRRIPFGFERSELDRIRGRIMRGLQEANPNPEMINDRISQFNDILQSLEGADIVPEPGLSSGLLNPAYNRRLRDAMYAQVEPVAEAPSVETSTIDPAPATEQDMANILTQATEAQAVAQKAQAPKKRGRPRKQPPVDPIDDPQAELPEPTPEVAATIDPEPFGASHLGQEQPEMFLYGFDEEPPAGDAPPPPTEPEAPLGWDGSTRLWDMVDRMYQAQILDERGRDFLNSILTVTDVPGTSKPRQMSVGDYYLLQRRLLGDKGEAVNRTMRVVREARVASGQMREHTITNKTARRILDLYWRATNNIRERTLWNTYTAPMLFVLNLAGNSVNMAIDGDISQAVNQWRPTYLKAAYRGITGDRMQPLYDAGIGTIFQKTDADLGRDISINMSREGESSHRNFGLNRSIDKWAGDNKQKEKLLKRAFTLSGLRGSDFFFDLHASGEILGRMMEADKYAREVGYEKHVREYADQIRAQYTRTGDADALMQELAAGDYFSPDDVRSRAINAGFTFEEAGDMAQQWRRHVTAMTDESIAYANSVLFSYDYTNADNALRSIFMFHYWYTRASAKYVRAIVRNPYLMVNYQRAIEALERESEDQPNAVKGMLRAFSGPGGYLIWIDPFKALSTAATFNRHAADDGDQKQFDAFMSQTGMFLNPLLQAAAAVVGISENRGIDPTGSGAVRRILGTGVNAVSGEFGWTYQGTPFQDAVGNTVQALSGFIGNENRYQSMDTTNRIMIRNGILDKVMGKHGIEQGTPLSEWSFEAVDELELEISNFDSGVPSAIVDAAYRDWSRAKFAQVATAALLPIGSSLRSETRDERLNINRADPLDGTPTQAELQITQSSPEGMPLTLRTRQFNSMFPSGELGRVRVSPDTGMTQEEFLSRPEMAPLRSFRSWQEQARSIGPSEFRGYMMQVSPAYRDYINQLPAEFRQDQDRFDNMSVGYQAFLAANGKRASMYDPNPRAASNPSAMDPAAQLFAWMQQNGYSGSSDNARPYRPYPL